MFIILNIFLELQPSVTSPETEYYLMRRQRLQEGKDKEWTTEIDTGSSVQESLSSRGLETALENCQKSNLKPSAFYHLCPKISQKMISSRCSSFNLLYPQFSFNSVLPFVLVVLSLLWKFLKCLLTHGCQQDGIFSGSYIRFSPLPFSSTSSFLLLSLYHSPSSFSLWFLQPPYQSSPIFGWVFQWVSG